MKRFLLSLTLLLTSAGIAFAQSVTVNKIWLEHGVTQNDQDGLRVHIEVELNGYKGSDMRAIAYFESPKGVGHKDLNNRYHTTDGNVSASKKFSPSYDNSTFNDLKIFIPLSELHLKEGKHTYYCVVQIYGPNGYCASSDYVSFIGTGSSTPSHQAAPASNRAQYSHLTPRPGSMESTGDTYYYYKDRYNNLADIRIFYNNEWKANCYVYTGSGDGTLYYFEKVRHDGTRWIFKEILQSMTGHQGSNATLYIADDWSYIQVDNYKFNIPVSKADFKQLMPRSSGGGGGYSPGGGNYNSGSGGSTPSYDNNLSESYYREMYSMWERNAESAYNSLTTLGASITYSDGSKEGSTLGSWSSSDYTRLKQDLRKAQSEMRTIRSEASRAGYTIHPSHWESASVSY